MKVTRLAFRDFRNIERAEWEPDPQVTVICGENAQGKTNLLEGIWLFTGGRSFRGARDQEMVRFGAEKAALSADFFAEDRDQQADIEIERKRCVTLNGIPQPAANRLTGRFCAVVFSPHHLTLVKGGPEERRRFLDAAICQVRPSYMSTLMRYGRVLAQRNALLKGWRQMPDEDGLSVWDERLAREGAEIRAKRVEYVSELSGYAAAVYEGLSGKREKLEVIYRGGETGSDHYSAFRAKLCETRRAHIEAGFTLCGPHRDDLDIMVGDLSARTFGSQGQQRSAVLSLKMAEASLLREKVREEPVILLDDVMSELDAMRQDYVANHLTGWQVFITCCDRDAVGRLLKGRVFEMVNGKLSKCVI